MSEAQSEMSQSSDGIQDQPSEQAAEPPALTPESTDGDKPQEPDWKAKYEAQKKVARDLEKKVKGEAGTLQQQLSEARKESETHAAKALRYEVAAEKGIPLELAARLTGFTKDELVEDADKLKDLLPSKTPREAYSLDRKQDPESKPSPNDLIRAALQRT